MSSDLMAYGTWTFPPGAMESFRAAPLAYPAHSHEEGSMAAAFAGASTAKKVSAVLTGARSIKRFLHLEPKGDTTLIIRGVLADDDWVDACARLGALARAASALGAKGHLTVESDGAPLGRLVLGARAIFDSRTGKAFEDRTGRAELMTLWAKVDGVPEAAKKEEFTPAEERALTKGWLAAEAKFRSTFLKGKPDALVAKQLLQLKADFLIGARAKVLADRKAKAAKAAKAAKR